MSQRLLASLARAALRDPLYQLRGLADYAAAIASGDVAPAAEQAERARACASCPALVTARGHGRTVWFCGPPGVDRRGHDEPTCGCPVLALRRTDGGIDSGDSGDSGGSGSPEGSPAEAVPVCAAVVGSKRCPRGIW